MRFVSLFAGIGGIDLGMERAGHECVGQVEIDDYCTKVLERHCDVPRWRDIRELAAEDLSAADCLAGGFPCQDISNADSGGRAGLQGKHSGLWFEFARLIRAVRPRFVIVENVPSVLVRGLPTILGDLAAIGYDAEWEGLPAAAFGAPHLRARVFICAYPRRLGNGVPQNQIFSRRRPPVVCDWWAREPAVARVAYGVPNRIHRLRCLGNAVVPQVAEYIGRLLAGKEGEHERTDKTR